MGAKGSLFYSNVKSIATTTTHVHINTLTSVVFLCRFGKAGLWQLDNLFTSSVISIARNTTHEAGVLWSKQIRRKFTMLIRVLQCCKRLVRQHRNNNKSPWCASQLARNPLLHSVRFFAVCIMHIIPRDTAGFLRKLSFGV